MLTSNYWYQIRLLDGAPAIDLICWPFVASGRCRSYYRLFLFCLLFFQIRRLDAGRSAGAAAKGRTSTLAPRRLAGSA